MDEGITATAGRFPTLYGGTTVEYAAMETVFHDVPYAPGLKTYEKSKLRVAATHRACSAARPHFGGTEQCSSAQARHRALATDRYGSRLLPVQPQMGRRTA